MLSPQLLWSKLNEPISQVISLAFSRLLAKRGILKVVPFLITIFAFPPFPSISINFLSQELAITTAFLPISLFPLYPSAQYQPFNSFFPAFFTLKPSFLLVFVSPKAQPFECTISWTQCHQVFTYKASRSVFVSQFRFLLWSFCTVRGFKVSFSSFLPFLCRVRLSFVGQVVSQILITVTFNFLLLREVTLVTHLQAICSHKSNASFPLSSISEPQRLSYKLQASLIRIFTFLKHLIFTAFNEKQSIH